MRFSLALALAIVLAACAAPQQFAKPSQITDLPAHWSRTANEVATAEPPPALQYRHWLASFNDSQLSSLVNFALEHNSDMQQAHIATAIAHLGWQRQQASHGPNLNLQAQAGKQRQANSDLQRVTSNHYQLSLQSQWQLDLWGKHQWQDRAFQLEKAQQLHLAQALKLSLAARIAKLWFQLKSLQQQRHWQHQQLVNLQETEQLINLQVQRGLKANRDLDSAISERFAAQADVEQLDSDIEQSQLNLTILLGSFSPPNWENNSTLPDLDDHWQLDVPVQQLLQRPDLTAAWLAVNKADALSQSAYWSRFPSLTLVADVGRSGLQFRDLSDSVFNMSNLMMQLLIPIFDGANLAHHQQQQQLQAQSALLQFRGQLQRAFHEVNNAVNNEALLRQQYESISTAITWAQQASTAATSAYQRGLLSTLELLVSQRQVFNLRLRLTQLHESMIHNRINLHLALGGDIQASQDSSHE